MRDTSPEAERFYFERLRQMTRTERFMVGLELTEAADQLLRAGVRRRYPEAEGEELEYQVLRARYGDELARKVYGR